MQDSHTMRGVSGLWLAISAVVVLTAASHSPGYPAAARCTAVGQHLLHARNRCQYVYCAYRNTPYGSGLVGVTRQCPPGTAIPRGLYARHVTGVPPMYHPMAMCSDRVYRSAWATSVCSVPKMAYGIRRIYTYNPRQQNPMSFRYPRKRFYRAKKMISHIYDVSNNRNTKSEATNTKPTTMPMMLNDLSGDITDVIHYTTPIESKMATMMVDMSEPVYQNEADALVAPSSGSGKNSQGVNDYQMDPAEEAEILRALHKLPRVEEPEILSEEDSNKVKQEIMNMIFGDL